MFGVPAPSVRKLRVRKPDGAPDHDGAPVLTGDMKVVFATPMDVPIKMVFGDTGAPAPKVAVQAAKGLVNTLETTDDQGRATLKLPPGKYRMENWPARGTPYLVTEGELVVGPTPRAEAVVATLHPAGIIEVTVVDAETGEGFQTSTCGSRPIPRAIANDSSSVRGKSRPGSPGGKTHARTLTANSVPWSSPESNGSEWG